MARVLTALLALAISWFAVVHNLQAHEGIETPDGMAATPPWLRIEADGTLWLRDEPLPAELGPRQLVEAMWQPCLEVPEAMWESMWETGETNPYYEGLFEGWVHITIAEDAPFSTVWERLYLAADRSYMHKFALESQGSGERVFVRLPWDLKTNVRQIFAERRFWVIQSGQVDQSGAGESGIRHSLGRDGGFGELLVDAHFATAAEAARACANEAAPGLLVAPDVPWTEVATALSLLASDGISWWPVPTEEPDMARQAWNCEWLLKNPSDGWTHGAPNNSANRLVREKQVR